MNEPKSYLCYCGLYCKMCSIMATLPKLAKPLLKTMQEDGWEHYGQEVFAEFPAFWEVLKIISTMDETTVGCKGGCGDPSCQIRVCAQKKGLEVCAYCADFPCLLLKDFTRRYPFLIKNNERIKEIGLDAWLDEQEELVAKGVTNKSQRENQ